MSVCGNDCDPRGKVKGFTSVTGIPVSLESALRSSAFKLQALNPGQCLYRLNDEQGHAHFKKGAVFIKNNSFSTRFYCIMFPLCSFINLRILLVLHIISPTDTVETVISA